MRRALAGLLLVCGTLDAEPDFWTSVRGAIRQYLGRPYAWGASGLKSFDCSGFVWRVLRDNGVYFKRTTARKLYFSLPATSKAERWKFGNIVFFDDLRHCGIVNDASTFYHAETSKGTTLSEFDPFWRRKVIAVRKVAGTP